MTVTSLGFASRSRKKLRSAKTAWAKGLVLGAAMLVCPTWALGQDAAAESDNAAWISDTGLALAPKNAAFYNSVLRGDEIVQNIWQSGTVEKLRQIPFFKELEIQLLKKWEEGEGEVGQVKAALANPNIGSLAQLAKDLFSNEIFIYGDGKYTSTYRELYKYQELFTGLQETAGDPELLREEAYALLENFSKEDMDRLRIPTTVVGFKLKDRQRALDHLDQLHGLISIGLSQLDELQTISKGFNRRDSSTGTMLSMTFKADDIPWDAVPMPETEEDAELAELAVQTFSEALEGRQLTFSIGVYNDYVILSVGEDGDITRQFKSDEHLFEHNQLRSLVRRAPESLIAVSYVSDPFVKASWELTFKDYLRRAGAAIGTAARKNAEENEEEVPEWVVDQVEEDLDWLDDQMLDIVPEFKGQLSYAWLTKDGIAGEDHPRTESVLFNGSEPLDVLKHLGESPLAFSTVRPASHPEWFELMVEAGQRAKWYLDYLPESGLMDEDDAEKFSAVVEEIWPLVSQTVDVIRDKFHPGFEDTEVGYVVSAGMESLQWWEGMEPSAKPLPMIELAKIAKVANQAKVRTGLAEMFEIANELVAAIRRLEPDAIPEAYSIPQPEIDTLGNAERYSYPIPADCPVPPAFLPQVVLGTEWIASGYSTTQIEAMLGESSFTDPAGLIKSDKPSAMATYINFAAINAVIRPWIEYGLIQEGKLDQDLIDATEDLPALTGTELLKVWDLLKVFGTVSVATTQQPSGQVITRWKWILQD